MNRLAPLLVIAFAATFGPVASAAAADRFPTFLAEREIDRERRSVLEPPGGWDDARQKAVIRVLERLDAPAALEVPWRLAARPFAGRPEVEDRLVRIEGRAKFVAPVVLSEEQAVLAGRPTFDLVRIVAADGTAADVAVPEAPRSWARWAAIDEDAFAIGLPLSTASFPIPAPPPAATAWPESAPAVLLAATAVGWRPPSPLGRLGMDYGLFATVVDGKRLEGGDSEAFYAVLTAVGRAAPGVIEEAAGKPAEIVPIINPAEKWFARHRGDPVTVAGTARRAVRISVDEPWRREQVGTDHYWELYVFVDTPLLRVGDRTQDDYPIVCCVRDLPAGFPTGEAISEQVRISGFAFKRYGYPLPDLDISSSQGDRRTRDQRMETALLVGRTLTWTPEPSVTTATNTLSWIFSAIAAVIGLVMVYGLFSLNRGRRRVDLPDRIDLPGGRD